jgi:hypothetical protein
MTPIGMTKPVDREGGRLLWPTDVGNGAYSMVYLHSSLEIKRGIRKLDPELLYEAWAFDGRHSWHLWKWDDEWVCTHCDSKQISEEHSWTIVQRLAPRFRQSLGFSSIAIFQVQEYDADGQAYVAYSCPIGWRGEGL